MLAKINNYLPILISEEEWVKSGRYLRAEVCGIVDNVADTNQSRGDYDGIRTGTDQSIADTEDLDIGS